MEIRLLHESILRRPIMSEGEKRGGKRGGGEEEHVKLLLLFNEMLGILLAKLFAVY